MDFYSDRGGAPFINQASQLLKANVHQSEDNKTRPRHIQKEVDPVTENKDSGFKRQGVSQTALRFRLICTHNLRGRADGSKMARERNFYTKSSLILNLVFWPFFQKVPATFF